MNCLCYTSPVYGGYGLMNLGMQIPESFILFAGPASCARHSAIASIQKNNKERNSYLFLSDEDISMGTVEEEIYRSVDEILPSLTKRPRVFILLFACILYLEGIDEKAVIDELSRRHSDVVFQVCLMNPISIGTDHAPVTMMYSRMAELFKNGEQEDTVNFIGNNVPIDRKCEIYSVLKNLGVRGTNHTTEKKNFQEFRKMGNARWNIVVKPEGIRAAKEMTPRIDYRFLPVSYEFDVIREQYEELFSMFGRSTDLSRYEKEAEKAVRNISEKLKGKTIALGSSASYRIFGMARMLVRNGFNVTDIFASQDIYDPAPPFDMGAAEWIQKNTDIRIHNVSNPTYRGKMGKVCTVDVAIGFNAGYFSDTKCIVSISSDEGMFGYGGVKLLMEKIDDALNNPKDLRTLVEKYGVVI